MRLEPLDPGCQGPSHLPAGTELGWAASVPQKSQVKGDFGMGWRLVFGLGLGVTSRTGLGTQACGREEGEPRPGCWGAWPASGERGLLSFLDKQLGGRFLSGEPRQLGPGFSQKKNKKTQTVLPGS